MEKHMYSSRLKYLIVAAICLFPLSGCTVGPKYHPPSATLQPPPIAYKELPKDSQNPGDWKVAQPQDAMLHGKWWEIYHDPKLNALEEQLNINNQNIRQSFENFMEARTLVAQARSQLFPAVAFAPSYQRSSSSGTSAIHRTIRIREAVVQAMDRGVDPLRIQPFRSIHFRWKPPGRPISGARFGIRFIKLNTTRNLAPPIWKTYGSPSKPAWQFFSSNCAARMQYKKSLTLRSKPTKTRSI